MHNAGDDVNAATGRVNAQGAVNREQPHQDTSHSAEGRVGSRWPTKGCGIVGGGAGGGGGGGPSHRPAAEC